MKITLISDTHAKHNQLVTPNTIRSSTRPVDLPGGDLLIHAGDFMTSGYSPTEMCEFMDWFESIRGYDTKVFIAGNHDRIMQTDSEYARGVLTGYKTIDYLQDEQLTMYFDGPNGDTPEDNVRIYGSPWQPEFYNWAFNLPRNGPGLAAKWEAIPDNTDILITHGPAYGYVDDVEGRRGIHLGCELLAERIEAFRPKIHVCGHIHTGHGYYFNGHTHFFNASILDERYIYSQAPFNFEWDKSTNEIKWL